MVVVIVVVFVRSTHYYSTQGYRTNMNEKVKKGHEKDASRRTARTMGASGKRWSRKC